MTVLKADQQAADRLLKAAVQRAVRMIRAEPVHTRRDDTDEIVMTLHPLYNRHDVVRMLTAAGESAALLLDERPAKKAAARKGAS